jgi:general secretion pathway protein D
MALAQTPPAASPESVSEPSDIAPPVINSPSLPEPTTAPKIHAAKIEEPKKEKPKEETGVLKRDAKGLVSVDFVDVEIADIAKSISELTKRNFLLDEKIRGKITIISPRPVTIEEAYKAFVSALEVKGFTIVPMGKILKIVTLQNMKGLPIPTDEGATPGGDDIFVTRLVPIRFTNAAEIVKTLRGLLSRNGDIISYDPTNTLILTDNVGNIRRLLKIVERIDQPGFQESVEIVKLKYAPAADTADKVIKIFSLQSAGGANPAQAGGAQSSQLISKIIPDERTNSLIVVANKEGANRVREVVKQIDRNMGDQIGKGRIHVMYLQYADATELAGTLSGVSTSSKSRSSSSPSRSNSTIFPQFNAPSSPAPAPSGGGGSGVNLLGENVKITAEPQTNALIVTASPADFEALLPVIRKLDVRRPQAFVEAMILEVDVDKAYQVGTSGNIATQIGSNNDTSLFGATTFGNTSSIFLPTSTTALQGLTAGVQGKTFQIPLAGGQNLTIPIFGGLFQALQSNGTLNVLSTPNILTRDNMEAEIVVGQVVPFVTAQGRDVNNQPINQIQRENVAITLRVTPQINASDELTLDIFQEIQDLVPGTDSATYGPTTSKRSARTTVLVQDGQTVTVGGLISDRISNSVSKVPLLGDIPLIGWLFKSKNSTKRKTSLVIFITPYIIRLPEDLQEISVRKNSERQRFLQENNVKEHPGIGRYRLDRELSVPPSTQTTLPASVETPSEVFLAPEPKAENAETEER